MSTYLTVRCEGRALELCCWDGETHELVSSAPMPRNDASGKPRETYNWSSYA